jgi:TonB family protein
MNERPAPHRAETHEPLDRVLDQRRARSGWARRLWGGTGAALLHVLVIGGAILGPQLFAKPPQPIEFVPVQLVPAPARGVERPAPPAPPQPAATTAPEPPPEPEPSAAPEPTTAPEPEPTQPTEKPRTPATAAPTAATPPPVPPTGPPGAQGAPNGRADSPFTATVGGVDNPTFTYGYYLDRMLLLIRGQWTRPPLGGGVDATVHFRILRDGTVESIELVSSSGYNSFDLAALRAVQAAAPLPPLPRSYREGELGINLIFH